MSGIAPDLELELDLAIRRAFETADMHGIELTPEVGALLRYSFCAGALAATRDRSLWSRLVKMHEAGGLQDPDSGL